MVVIKHDSYYKDLSNLSEKQRERTNFDSPDALETELLIESLLQLKQGKKVHIPVYDYHNHIRLKETLLIKQSKVIIVEGILIFSVKKLRELFDLKIFIDVDCDIRFIRRLKRDIVHRGRSLNSVEKQYTKSVKLMHKKYVEKTKYYADLVFFDSLNKELSNLITMKIRDICKIED